MPLHKVDLKDHEIYRGKLCVVCINKAKTPLTPTIIKGLKKHASIFESISHEDEKVPTKICEKCITILCSKNSGKGDD